MDENHQDKTESKLIATEDIRWSVSRKSNLWVPKHKKRTGFEDKTLWDWLQLVGILAIPFILGIATLLFGIQQANLAQQQHENDQRQAQDQQQAAILQTYIDNIQDLLLNHNLLKASSFDITNPYYDVAILARARTLTALQGLDSGRKGRLLIFLYEAQLVGFSDSYDIKNDPIINLDGANLERADLTGANLSGANLSSVDLSGAELGSVGLSGAELSYARLINADLSGADLDNADLSYAKLNSANLNRAILSGADLRHADLRHANFSYADLSSSDLRNANLERADLTGASFFVTFLTDTKQNDAKNLTQQQLDQVYTCKSAILPKGLICHHNQ